MDMYDAVKKHIDEMFEELLGEKEIEIRQCYDVCIGFIEGLHWVHVVDDELALKLSDYTFGKTMELLLEEELKNAELGM